MLNLFRWMIGGAVFWWSGPDRQAIHLAMHDDGGMTFTFPDPNYVAPRERLERVIAKQPIKWALGIVSGVVVVVLGAVLTRMLGLT